MERRRFSLPDATALIAATAGGLGLVRGHFLALQVRQAQIFTSWSPMVATFYRVAGFGPLLAAWSFAMIGPQLVPPRPSFRHLARSPGFGASLASGFGIVFCSATDGVEGLTLWMRGRPVLPPELAVDRMPLTVVIAIESAWISIAARGWWRRRRGRDLRERLAQAVACAWILPDAAQGVIIALR